MEIYNPANGSVVKNVEVTSVKDLAHKVKIAAERSPKAWFQDLGTRVGVIKNFRKGLQENAAVFAKVTAQETGKPVRFAEGEIKASLARIDWFLQNISSHFNNELVDSQPGFDEEISWEPLGTIGVVSAWNYPYFVGLNVLIPALLTGNAVLYKPSEFSTLTGIQMVDLLHEVGVPKSVLSAVIGSGEIGAALSASAIDGVFFTGSVETAQKIANQVASRMIRIGIEAGGKDAAYVREDADISKTAELLASGAFYNSGQSCCGIERIYVHKSVGQKFVDEFTKFAKDYVPGNPMDASTNLGPLTRPQHARVLDEHVAEAVQKGGVLVLEGGLQNKDSDKSAYYAPVVVVNPPDSCRLMREESFGPVVGIQFVTDDVEAIEKINASDLGLTASAHTQDVEVGRSLLQQLDVGTVYLNNCDRVSPYLPWSGRKLSGVGATLSSLGIRAFQQPKAWHIQKVE